MIQNKISILIPTLESSRTLAKTLDSIFSNEFKNFEVIIIDQGSKNGTLSIAKKYNSTKIITIKEKGAAVARNAGIRAAEGKIVYFVDSDCYLPCDSLSKVNRFFIEYPEISGIGGPLLPLESMNLTQEFSNRNFLDIMKFPTNIQETIYHKFQGSLITGNCAYKKAVLDEVGGFDVKFGNCGEDIELCWRVTDRGHKLYFYPDLKVYHIFPHTLRRLIKQYLKWGIASSKLRKKFFNTPKVDWKLYLIFFKSLRMSFLPVNHERYFDLLRCFTIMVQLFGKILGSVKEKILNL